MREGAHIRMQISSSTDGPNEGTPGLSVLECRRGPFNVGTYPVLRIGVPVMWHLGRGSGEQVGGFGKTTRGSDRGSFRGLCGTGAGWPQGGWFNGMLIC